MRQLGGELKNGLASITDVSVIEVIGGRKRSVQVALDPQRMAAFNITTLAVLPALQMQNTNLPSGSFAAGNNQFTVETGTFLRSAEDVMNLVVGAFGERPVRLMDIATVTDGPAELDSYAFFGVGPQAAQIVRSRRLEVLHGHPVGAAAGGQPGNPVTAGQDLLDDPGRFPGVPGKDQEPDPVADHGRSLGHGPGRERRGGRELTSGPQTAARGLPGSRQDPEDHGSRGGGAPAGRWFCPHVVPLRCSLRRSRCRQ